jgi:hypothetical protein
MDRRRINAVAQCLLKVGAGLLVMLGLEVQDAPIEGGASQVRLKPQGLIVIAQGGFLLAEADVGQGAVVITFAAFRRQFDTGVEVVVHFFLASARPSATLNWPAAQPRPPRGKKQGKPKTRRRLLHAPRGWPLVFSELFHFFLATDLTSGKINTRLATLRGESTISVVAEAQERAIWKDRDSALHLGYAANAYPPIFFGEFCRRVICRVCCGQYRWGIAPLRQAGNLRSGGNDHVRQPVWKSTPLSPPFLHPTPPSRDRLGQVRD